MSRTTCIRNAAWVAACEPASDRHVYRRDIDVAFTDDTIVHVGRAWHGQVDEEIDGRERFVMPGLIDVHAHPHTEPSYKGLREEHGVPEMYMTGLYERGQAFKLDEAGRAAGAVVAYSELLASGVTTLADLSAPCEGWIELLARSGLRGFIGPGYASARWSMPRRHELGYSAQHARGDAHRGRARPHRRRGHPCGRYRGRVPRRHHRRCAGAEAR
jgi:cytosine/adenosine deaminase-related metal-dependent hydrolase